MNKPIGGRGKRAPYNTVTLRIPEPIADEVEDLADHYRNMSMNGLLTQADLKKIEPWKSQYKRYQKAEVLEALRTTLKQKKSAKITAIKLLQVLLPELDISEKDLEQ